MPKIHVSTELVADLLFGYANSAVSIDDAKYDANTRSFAFDISGPDVPEAEVVTGLCSVQTNRCGERLHTLEFKPA